MSENHARDRNKKRALFGALSLIAVCVIAYGAYVFSAPNPMSQGKKLSEWVEMLGDADPTQKARALEAIALVKAGDARRAKATLRQLAKDTEQPPLVRGRASAILWHQFRSDGDLSVKDLYRVAQADANIATKLAALDALKGTQKQRQEVIAAGVSRLEREGADFPAFSALKAIGPDALPALDEALSRHDESSMENLGITALIEAIKNPGAPEQSN